MIYTSDEVDSVIREVYETGGSIAVVERLPGVKRAYVNHRAKVLDIHVGTEGIKKIRAASNRMRNKSVAEARRAKMAPIFDFIREVYPTQGSKPVVEKFGISKNRVTRYACDLGVKCLNLPPREKTIPKTLTRQQELEQRKRRLKAIREQNNAILRQAARKGANAFGSHSGKLISA